MRTAIKLTGKERLPTIRHHAVTNFSVGSSLYLLVLTETYYHPDPALAVKISQE